MKGSARSGVITLSVVAGGLYLVYELTRWRQLHSAGYDLGIFDQAVRHYAHFQLPYSPLKGDSFNLMGDHFHPIIATLAPLYWLWDDPRMLLIAQSVLVAGSIPIVHRFAARRLGSGWLPLALTTVYALGWPIQRLIDYDFHEICFAVPLLAWAIDALDDGRDTGLVISCAGLLLVREDMGVVVALMGVLRLIRPGRRWLGAVLLAVGGVMFWWVTSVVLPHFSPTGEFAYWDYPDLGADAAESIGFILAHPIQATELLVTPASKLVLIGFLLLPLLLLPLGSAYSLLAAPLVVQRLWSDRPLLWTTDYHYSAPPWVILFLAAIDVLGRWAGRRPRLGRAASIGLLVAALAMPVIDGLWRPSNGTISHPFLRLAGPAWRVDQHARDQLAVLSQIPANTCVEVDDRLVPRLTRTNRVAIPGATEVPSDYIAVDLSQPEVGFTLQTPDKALADALADGYREVFRAGQLVLLQHPSPRGPSQACGPLAP